MANRYISLSNATSTRSLAPSSDSGTTDIDNTPPTLIITSNRPQLKAGEVALITFTFSEDPQAFFAIDDILVSGGTLTDLSDTGLIRTATFTPTPGMDNGTASITVAAGSYTDPASNAGAAGTSPSLTFDTRAPAPPSLPDLDAASDTGVLSNDNITKTVTPTFAGTAESGTTVKLYSGATLLGEATAVDGKWLIVPTAPLAEGTHYVNASATDAAGNVSAASSALSVTIDTTAPLLAITSNVNTLAAGETATITFTFSEDPGGSFTWDGAAGDVLVSGGTLGPISGTGLTRAATFTPASDTDNGTASITVAAGSYTDPAGNAGAAGATPSLTFDTLAPAALVTGVHLSNDTGASTSDFITGSAEQTISGTLSAPLASDEKVQISLDNGANWIEATESEQVFSKTVTLTGSGTLQVRVVDRAGNVGPVHSQAYVLDTQAPTVTIALSDAELTLGETAVVTITFSEAVTGFTAASLSFENGTLSAFTPSGALTYTATFTPSTNVSDNSNVIILNPAGVTDAAGNAVTGPLASLNYTVDTLATPTPPAPTPPAPTPPAPTPPPPVNGGTGADGFVSTPANEVFDGQGGTDSVVFSGNLADYVLVVENGMPVSITGPDGFDRFISIERLVFADGTLAFDDIALQGSRLYEAAFNRAPDASGMGFWVGERDADRGDLLWMASHFLHSEEFRDLYGPPESLSNEQFLELMYHNVLDRLPDAEGFSFWMDQLDTGYGRERLMVAFTESIENVGASPIEGVWYL